MGPQGARKEDMVSAEEKEVQIWGIFYSHLARPFSRGTYS